MKLVNPTDEQLNAAFAEKVAGWTRYEPLKGEKRTVICRLCGPERGQTMLVWKDGSPGGCYPNWAKSADAVLPWLEKCGHWQAHSSSKGIHIFVEYPDRHNRSDDQSFPRAAVIALLRANGVEVEFTP